MTSSPAPRAAYAPVFDWRPPSRRKLSLLSFIAASAVLHGVCFYLFQIIYPPTISLLPPPARISLINADTEEGRVLLRWIEAEDPALSSTTQRPPDAASFALPNAEHVPSYVGHRPALKELPHAEPDLRIPSAQPPGPVRTPRTSVPTAAAVTPSRVEFGDTDSLGAAVMPAMKFTATGNDAPQVALFRIAINAAGVVQYCFLENSSGDTSLDAQARQQLIATRFPEVQRRPGMAENRLLWTTATFEWGTDIVPAAPPTPSPAQP